MNTLETALSLGLFELRCDSVAILLLVANVPHVVDFFCDFTDLLLEHVTLLSQVLVSLLLADVLLLNRFVRLLVRVELVCCVFKLRLVRSDLISALLELACDFVSSAFYALDLGLLALNVSLDLRHLVHQLVERGLNLLPVPPQLLSLLPHFHVHALEDLLFLSLDSLLLGKFGFDLRVLSLDLVALFSNIELLIFVVFDLPLRLGDF